MAKDNSAEQKRNRARENARQIAAAQAKKEKTAKTILYVGIAVVGGLRIAAGQMSLGQVTAFPAGIGAQVELRLYQSGLSPGSCRLPCCGARWHLCGHGHRVEEFAGASQRG